jgi:hypothetical protein
LANRHGTHSTRLEAQGAVERCPVIIAITGLGALQLICLGMVGN